MTFSYLNRPDGCKIAYTIDDHTNPWEPSETILFVHGLAESGLAWRAWIPYFSRHFKVVCMDLRGFGQSSAMSSTHHWTMDELLDDIEALITHLNCSKVHLVGAKSGGSMVLKLAADRPHLIHTLIGVTPPLLPAVGVEDWLVHINSKGVMDWARQTMKGRLGSTASTQEIEWWLENIQGKTAISTLQSYLLWVPKLDIRNDIPNIHSQTLIITTTGSGLRSLEGVKEWVSQIKNARLHIIEGDAWHAAGAYPDLCAKEVLSFILQQSSSKAS
jgi:pimeloyl-ACP methyl ester carboxylesterase